ncbi:uncharacterized protein [Hoplias malabaricus]|uniref:uncharacterized protein n=1 Tax=Hoplias malabaricus TaxID=27720 RepID=UPI003462519B
MPRSKEISEVLRKQVVEAHQSGKGYKLISKGLGLPKTTVRSILRKWKQFGTVGNRPRSGRPPKISVRTRREIIRQVMKNPCTTSKDLQVILASANIHVHDSTIRRLLGIHGRPTLSGLKNVMDLMASAEDEESFQEMPEKSGSSDRFKPGVKAEDNQHNFNERNSSKGTGDGAVVTTEKEHVDDSEAASQDDDESQENGHIPAGDDKGRDSGDDTDSDWW